MAPPIDKLISTLVDDARLLTLLDALMFGPEGRSAVADVVGRAGGSEENVRTELDALVGAGLVAVSDDPSAVAGRERLYWVGVGKGLRTLDRLRGAER